jgi:hypothetical protein
MPWLRACLAELGRLSRKLRARANGGRTLLVVAVLLWTPLFVACVWLHHNDRWAPVYDMALFEMRVRDVGTPYTPLVGLGGRLSRWPEVGSHPGPLAFYLLAPAYRLLGGSYWALRVSIALLASASILLALLIARRRAGTLAMIATGVVLALLELGFGLLTLTEAWNPYVPVLWFAPFLLAAWSVFAGDVKFLPVAAALGSLCGQTHISYLPVCGGLMALGWLLVFGRWLAQRRKGLPRRELGVACAASIAVALVLWAPPLFEEWMWERANISILADHFLYPPESAVGFAGAARLLLERLDVWFLVTQGWLSPGFVREPLGAELSPVRGAIVFAMWLLSAVYAWRLGPRSLVSLHATAASALGLGFVAASRIIGFPFIYVVFFAWTISSLVLLSILGSVGRLIQARRLVSARGERWLALAGIAIIAACSLRLSSKVAHATASHPTSSAQLAALAPIVARALHERAGGPASPDSAYLVTWEDALYAGGQAFGLLNELERRGIFAFTSDSPILGASLGWHRVLDPAAATARIHFANGVFITEARAMPGAVQIAYADLRTPSLREEHAKLRSWVIQSARRIGRPDLVPLVDRNLAAVQVASMSQWESLAIGRMNDIGLPAAVFILPATAAPVPVTNGNTEARHQY